ncbi:Nn.00g087490.m01.CDS01 [Neocucurbitaria sp. VM-36]
MSSKDAHLYGARPKSRTKAKEISSSSTLAFSSTLSTLIKASSSESNKPAPGRARPQKEDIFKTHNKNVKKRALKDLEDSDFTQKHRGRTTEEKGEDETAWKRTKRRMEEKARLYDALKRGDIEDVDDKYGVDFDRKWAEKQEKGEAASASESESEASEEEEELVDYVDEFGRTRKGTRAEAARESRRKHTLAANEPDRFTARPSMPDAIIYGDTVQSNAFNPDETITQQMADLAAKRDKELTPPPELHFDGRAEARQRGTGFFHFSKDEEERMEQMARMEKEREETERVRRERKELIDKRKEMIREKKRLLQEKRSAGKAEKFLDELGAELFKGEDEAEDKEEDKEKLQEENEVV